jgi:hypothetical protein
MDAKRPHFGSEPSGRSRRSIPGHSAAAGSSSAPSRHPDRRGRHGAEGWAAQVLTESAHALADACFASLITDVGGTSPMEAELWLASLLDVWDEGVLEGGADPEVVFGSLHIERALDVATPAARVFVGALAKVADDPEVAGRAAEAAAALDRRKVRLPNWAKGLGDRRFRRAFVMDHELDDGHTVMLGFAYPGGAQYSVGVYIDVNLGLVVKDLLIGGPIASVEVAARDAGHGATIEPIEPQDARARVEEAFSRLDAALESEPDLPVYDDVAEFRRFVAAHVADLPEGGSVPTRFPDAHDRPTVIGAAVGTFLSSPEAHEMQGRWDRSAVTHVADHLASFAVETGGDPVRVSPASVEMFLRFEVPAIGCFGSGDGAMVVDVVRAWASWSLRSRGLERWLDETLTSVDAFGFMLGAMLEVFDAVDSLPDDAESVPGIGELIATMLEDDDVAAPVGDTAAAVDGRAPDLAPAREERVRSVVDTFPLHATQHAVAVEIAIEIVRADDAAFDGEYAGDAIALLVLLAVDPATGLNRGRADIWAGGLLYALAQDDDRWTDPAKPEVSATQFATIVGASQSALIARASKIRSILDDLDDLEDFELDDFE